MATAVPTVVVAAATPTVVAAPATVPVYILNIAVRGCLGLGGNISGRRRGRGLTTEKHGSYRHHDSREKHCEFFHKHTPV
jgi:hypothetical protein